MAVVGFLVLGTPKDGGAVVYLQIMFYVAMGVAVLSIVAAAWILFQGR